MSSRYKWVFAIVLLVLLVLFVTLYEINSSTIQSTYPVGSFDHAELHVGGLFSPTLTVVYTEQGSVIVDGLFASEPGHPLEIRVWRSGPRALCAVGRDGSSCANVVNDSGLPLPLPCFADTPSDSHYGRSIRPSDTVTP